MDNKSTVAIIQARMSSTRLPGKVLLPLQNKPIIQHIVDRLRFCKNVGHIIVATSNRRDDNKIYDYCKKNNIDCYRGSLNNVLSRYVEILSKNKYDYCVRVTGDCPLIHPPFIDAQIEALIKNDGDLIWTEKQSTVLEGQGVISKRAILKASQESNDPDDLEHVGSKYFIKNKNIKYIKLIIPNKYFHYNYRLCLDEKKDYEFLEFIYSHKWDNHPIDLESILIWLDDLSSLKITNKKVQHSLINKQIDNQKSLFKPNIVGYFLWNKI